MLSSGYVGAIDTIAEVLAASVTAVDAQMGEGFAKGNPVLLGAFLQSVVLERQGTSLGEELKDHFISLRISLDGLK